MKLEFVDTWIYNEDDRKITETLGTKRYRLEVSNGRYLRVCMTYTDRPGAGLENNLNLVVYHQETGKPFLGNEERRTDIPSRDLDNNVEVVRLEDPADGTYDIEISARVLAEEGKPVDFAIVVTGDGISSLREIE